MAVQESRFDAEELARQIIPICRPVSVLSENKEHIDNLRAKVASLIQTAFDAAIQTRKID